MDFETLSHSQLKTIAHIYNLPGKTKEELVTTLSAHYYKLKKYMSYTYIRQLGSEGKDGRTFLVKDRKRKEYALKLFRDNKNVNQIQKEVDFQVMCSECGIAPKIVDFDIKGKYIVMEKLDDTLYDYFVKQNGQLTISQQKHAVNLFKKLDDCGVLHGDPNPLNFMKKGRKWYMIDYGFAEKITSTTRRRFGKNPNFKCMTLGLLLKLRDIYPETKLEYLEQVMK